MKGKLLILLLLISCQSQKEIKQMARETWILGLIIVNEEARRK